MISRQVFIATCLYKLFNSNDLYSTDSTDALDVGQKNFNEFEHVKHDSFDINIIRT